LVISKYCFFKTLKNIFHFFKTGITGAHMHQTSTKSLRG
jgi:hypothetical protein